MRERLTYTIAKLRRQIKNGNIDAGTCETLIAQIENYVEVTGDFCDDMEYAEFCQVMEHRRTIQKIDEILKDFGKRWKQ